MWLLFEFYLSTDIDNIKSSKSQRGNFAGSGEKPEGKWNQNDRDAESTS